MKIKPCPFCGKPPTYKSYPPLDGIRYGITDKGGTHFVTLEPRATEKVECNNLSGCSVRPSIRRIESGDARQIWNTRK